MTAVNLLKYRRKAAREAQIEDVMRGSLVMMKRVCGKPNCRCLKGYKHKSLYLSQYHKGFPRMIYIPKRAEVATRRMIRNYRKLKVILHKISDANIQLIVLPKEKSR